MKQLLVRDEAIAPSRWSNQHDALHPARHTAEGSKTPLISGLIQNESELPKPE